MAQADETGNKPVNPREVALAYDRVVSAHWRGETDEATSIGTWFEAHWSDQAPPEPDDPPEGTSILGGAGSGIRWYARDDVVLGYVSRRDDGCYRVRMSEAVPSLIASWDILEREATRQPDTDHLLRHTGASSVTAQSTREEREPAVGQRRPLDAVPNERDVRVLVEPDSRGKQNREGDGFSIQEPRPREVPVAVHVLEPATTEDSSSLSSGA